MDFSWAKCVAILSSEFSDAELVENALNVLKVGHVSAGANYGIVANSVQTLDILEACKRSI